MAYRPSCSTRITGVLRTLPLLAPRLVTITTGSPVSRSVVPRAPSEFSYSSTWSRTQAAGLGSYCPSTGIALVNTSRARDGLPGCHLGPPHRPGHREHRTGPQAPG